MSEILVTGINGFVGHHLANELVAQGHEVIGAGREAQVTEGLEDVVKEYFCCDFTNSDEVSKLPLSHLSAIINLAGLAAVGPSFDNPALYMDVNVSVLSVVCEQIKTLGLKDLRVVAVSSGAVYSSSQPMPLSEVSQTDKTSSPYAASKLAMEEYANNFRSAGYDCVVARPFNHIGPGQLSGFLLPDLYENIEASIDGVIKVGNLQTKRDYTDVRDVARAYIALATNDKLGSPIYNVCSGQAISGEELLQALEKARDRTDLKVVVDDKLFRPSDSPVLYGDNSRLREETGWSPAIPFEQTVTDFVASKRT